MLTAGTRRIHCSGQREDNETHFGCHRGLGVGRNRKTIRNRVTQRRDDRRRRVAELFRQGLLLKDIARRVGASINTISSDVAALHSDWLRAAASHYRDAMVQQLQKLMPAEDEALGAWLASKEPSVVERDEVKSGVDGDTRRHLRAVRHQCGNAGYIRTVLRCIEIRCRLLGLYAKEG